MTVKNQKPLSVLLVSGIFTPDVGGPAIHVRHIAEHLHAKGWKVTVLAFGGSSHTEQYRVIRVPRTRNPLGAWLRYGFAVVRESSRHDVIYAFDLTTSGLSSAFAARLFGRPFLLRIGGDPIWERVVEKGKRFMPMRAYYEQSLHRKDKPVLYRLIKFVVRSADAIVTYTDFLKDIYINFYGVDPGRLTIIRNPFMNAREAGHREKDTFTFIFAGRFVSYKNLPLVIRAFLRLQSTHPETRLLLVGDGPDRDEITHLSAQAPNAIRVLPKQNQETLFSLIRASSVALAPALTEFNPNFILESLSLGKPAIISVDNGLSFSVPEEFQFDPMDEDDLLRAMSAFMGAEQYERACAFVDAASMSQTWEHVVGEHERLITDICAS